MGARKAEACAINTSLSSVGDVFEALSTKQKHVPFRNSKLTYLLKVGVLFEALIAIEAGRSTDHSQL